MSTIAQEKGDLGLTAEIALQSDNHALFQNLFGNGGWGQDLCLLTQWRVEIGDYSDTGHSPSPCCRSGVGSARASAESPTSAGSECCWWVSGAPEKEPSERPGCAGAHLWNQSRSVGADAEQSTIATSDRTDQGRLGNQWSLMTQAFVKMPEGRRGRPFWEGQDLPPQIQQALVLRAAGGPWIDCAAGAGVDVRNLRKWRKHPQTEPFLNEQIRGNLQQAQTGFSEAAPKLAERLIKLGLDERTKGYSAVAAIAECFKILRTGVVDQQQQEQIEAIKAQLTALEGGTPNVIDV